MKKIVVFITALLALHATAQEFDSAEEALKFLNQHFKGSTYVKNGDTWVDPVELMFDKNEVNIFAYKGSIKEKDYIDYDKGEAAKLVPDDSANGVMFFTWPEVQSVDLNIKNGQYWIVVTGVVYNDVSEPVAESRTLYVAEKDQAQRIKIALEYCLLEYGE